MADYPSLSPSCLAIALSREQVLDLLSGDANRHGRVVTTIENIARHHIGWAQEALKKD